MKKVLDVKSLLISAGVSTTSASKFAKELTEAMLKYNINTDKRIAAFLANLMTESGNFRSLQENLNYSAQGLKNTWPNRFSTNGSSSGSPNSLARQLHRKPELIANHVYGDRGGNRGVNSGDGWKYRGHGLIQTTFLSNYRELQRDTGIPCVNNPEILTRPKEAALAAAHYWNKTNCNRYADGGDFDGTADLINRGRKTARVGDSHGWSSRLANYKKLMEYFKGIGEFQLDSVDREKFKYNFKLGSMFQFRK